jgi:predicted AlkP superfamily phosphohydrolase/phosphomutase
MSENKALFIGLDGVPYGLIKQLSERGVMPACAALFDQGTLAEMDSSIPEVSCVSWTSIITGVNPGQHGVFGFYDLEPQSFNIRFHSFDRVSYPTIWSRLGESEKKSVVINVPATYPAQPMNGILVSGFVAPDLEKATWPRSLVSTLLQLNYQTDLDLEKASEHPETLFEGFLSSVYIRASIVRHLLSQDNWSLFFLVFTETDRLHHYLWHTLEDPDHEHHNTFLDCYREIDTRIGEIVEDFGQAAPEGLVVMASDHGFGRLRTDVNLNRWLCEEGYLAFLPKRKPGLSSISPNSKAFALDPGRIYINTDWKFPGGSVSTEAEYGATLLRLKKRLAALSADETSGGFVLNPRKHSSEQRVMNDVFRKQELYSGPFMDSAPDLVCLPNSGFNLKAGFGADEVLSETSRTGMHTQHDAFLYVSKTVDFKRKPTVLDIAPILLNACSG